MSLIDQLKFDENGLIPAITRDATDGLGADVAIVAIGVPSLANDALKLVRNRGRVSLFAGFSKGVQAELDVNAVHYGELTVTGSFGLTRLLFSIKLVLRLLECSLVTTGLNVAHLLT